MLPTHLSVLPEHKLIQDNVEICRFTGQVCIVLIRIRELYLDIKFFSCLMSYDLFLKSFVVICRSKKCTRTKLEVISCGCSAIKAVPSTEPE